MALKSNETWFEPLESRQMLSSISYEDGILNLTGDRTSCTYFTITKDLRRMTVSGISATRMSAILQQIGSGRPSMIRIKAGSANDKISFEPGVTIPSFIDAGGGKDRIVAGSGNDTILGGSGTDRIDAGRGRNYVLGGSGDDTIQVQSGDTVWGQAGADSISGATDEANLAYPARPLSLANEFRLGSNTDSRTGFKVLNVTLATLQQSQGATRPTVSSERTVSVSRTSQVYSGGVTTQTWSTEDGSVVITVVLKSTTSTRNMTITVANNGSERITKVHFDLPYVFTTATANHAVLSAYRGGTDLPWPLDTYTHQNSATWPNYGYSPMGIFYNKVTGEGVGIVSFNDRLDNTQVSWVLSNDWVGAASRVWPNLDSGGSATYEIEIYHGNDMPGEQFTHYRKTFLQPFMARQGIPEANYRRTAIWSSANFVDPNIETLTDIVKRTIALGATGHVQWAAPDGLSSSYEPYQPDVYWAKDLLSTSKLSGLTGLGVLVNPYVSRRIPNGNGTYHQDQQYLDDPAVIKIVKAQRDDMVRRGVNFAFWDAGNGPRNGSGQDWLNMLWSFKRVGITIAPENSCDIAAWVTGADMHYPHNWGDLIVAKGVTPNATQFAVQHWDETKDINGVTTEWWDDAQRKGMVPILTETQLKKRWQQLGLG